MADEDQEKELRHSEKLNYLNFTMLVEGVGKEIASS